MQRRRRRFWSMCVACSALVVVLLGLPTPGSAQLEITQVRHPYSGKMVDAAAGRVLVVYRPGTTAQARAAATARVGARVIASLVPGRLELVAVLAGESIASTIRAYQGLPEVVCAEADYVFRPVGEVSAAAAMNTRALPAQITPNDPLWGDSGMYGPKLLQCPYAWEVQTGSPTKVIAIIDEGVDRQHEDLAAKIWTNPGETPGNGVDDDGNGYVDDVYGWDTLDNDNDPSPVDPLTEQHGTHVAGTSGAIGNNGVGITGVSWGTKIMSLRALGPFGGTAATVAEAILYAADNGAHVINMSLGGPYSATEQVPIDYAYNRGVVICAAAGNSNKEFTTNLATWDSPVCNDGADPSTMNEVIGVAATDQMDVKADFSNYSGAYKLVDVSAPGVSILSTLPGNMYGGGPTWSGTSMSCPHVAGLAGLLVSEYPTWAPDAVIDQIRATADSIDDKNPFYIGKLGTGRVNAASAVGIDLPPGAARAVAAVDTPNDEGGSITVTWRRSKDDGTGQNDIVKYELYRAQDDPGATFSNISGDLPPGTQSYTDAPTVDGVDYYYYVRAYDVTTQVDSNVAGPARSRDDLPPPQITNLTAGDRDGDAGGAVELAWGPYSAPSDFAEYRIYRGDRQFSDVTGMTPLLTPSDPAVLSYLDQSSDLQNGTEYFYAVTAVDDSVPENEQTSVITASAIPAIDFEHTFPAGISLAAVPAYPFDTSPVAVFGVSPAQGAAQQAAAELARWDPLMQPTPGYHYSADDPDDPFLSVLPGRGFWLKLSTSKLVSVDGTAVATPAGQDFSIPIVPGWQQIGNPYTTAIVDFTAVTLTVAGGEKTLEQAVASGIAEDYAWLYNAGAGSYQLVHGSVPFAVQSLPAYQALWFRAYSSAMLNLKKPAGALSVRARAREGARRASVDDWAIPVVATVATENVSDAATVLGVHPNAAAITHIQGPPNPSPYVDVYFPEPGRQGGPRYATDFVSSMGGSHAWELVVDTDIANAEIVLRFPNLSELPRGHRAFLVDRDAGKRQSLRTKASYTYHSGPAGGQRRFTVEVTTDAAAALTVSGLNAVATRGAGVDIAFNLSQPARVRVEILNAAGRLVRAVSADGMLSKGRNVVLWNGRGAQGAQAPSGIYLLRVRASGDDGQQASGITTLALTR